MNNKDIQPGSIWMVKSLNEFDKYYNGMSLGSSRILIISVFKHSNDSIKFTYVKLSKYRKKDNNIDYLELKLKDTKFFLDLSELFLGTEEALDYHIYNLQEPNYITIKDIIQSNFNIILNNTLDSRKIINSSKINQQRIHKFGIDIFVTENTDVKLTKNKKLILSNKAKQDIIYNSKTEEDIRILSDKYQIYPVKAIKEIRNRLVYQHKQVEG